MSLTNNNITAQVDDDYNTLLKIQSKLLQYLDDDGYMPPLAYFSEDERQPNGDWVTVVSAQSFDDAFTHMDADIGTRPAPARHDAAPPLNGFAVPSPFADCNLALHSSQGSPPAHTIQP